MSCERGLWIISTPPRLSPAPASAASLPPSFTQRDCDQLHRMCGDNGGCEPCKRCLSASTIADSEEVDEPFELFVCQICLDIVYKPIVQACGHVFCFWCVRRSMNQSKPSQCPVCRRPYIHFPRVCQLLHFFLMKAWPEDYKRKANEIQALEESTKIFSPRILSPNNIPAPKLSASSSPSSCDQPHLTGTLTRVLNHCPIFPEVETEKLLPMSTTLPAQEQIISFVDHQSTTDSKQHEIVSLIAANEITTEDLSCICCRKLVYRPVVLNCGEVLCESCCAETRCFAHPGSNPTCPSCRSIHPSGPLGVCLALHHYLERAFPPLYSQRKEESEVQSKQCHATPLCPVAPVDPDVDDKRCLVHIGAGCDGCGMFPILGPRYHCRECGEQVGYDLCGSCYNNATTSNTGSSTVDNYHSPAGRFNQQHSPEHRMEEMVSDRRFAAVHFNAIVEHLVHVAPLNLNLENGVISRRRQQQILDDFDDYIDTLVGS